MTPGLLGIRPQRFSVTVAEGRRPASSAGNRPGPAPAYYGSSRDCVPSCPLLRPPGAAVFSSPLGVYDFVKRTSLLRYDEAALRAQAPDIVRLADVEGLHAHGRAVTARLTPPTENDE